MPATRFFRDEHHVRRNVGGFRVSILRREACEYDKSCTFMLRFFKKEMQWVRDEVSGNLFVVRHLSLAGGCHF